MVDLPTANPVRNGVTFVSSPRGSGHPAAPLNPHMQVEQPGQRQVNLGDLIERKLLVQTAQFNQIVCQGGVGSEPGPLRTCKRQERAHWPFGFRPVR